MINNLVLESKFLTLQKQWWAIVIFVLNALIYILSNFITLDRKRNLLKPYAAQVRVTRERVIIDY